MPPVLIQGGKAPLAHLGHLVYNRPTTREQSLLGLDLPIRQRYVNWLVRLATLDIGTSLHGQSVTEVPKVVIPPTLPVFFTETILAFMIGMWLTRQQAWQWISLLSWGVQTGSLKSPPATI